MGPLAAPSRICHERCSSSSQPWPSSHRAAAAQAHGRDGRRRTHEYAGVVTPSSPECGTRAPSSSALFYSSMPQRHKACGLGDGAAGTTCFPQSARSDIDVFARALSSLALTDEQRQQSEEAASQLLQAIARCRDDSALGRLLTCCGPSTLAPSKSAEGSASLEYTSQTNVAVAALLLPSLTWQWLSVAELDGWVDRGLADLLREALLVQKASCDASASINELVGWCLDNCSGPAAALAALWGQQQAHTLPPRRRSFYGLLLHRLGAAAAQQQQPASALAAISSAASGGVSLALAPNAAAMHHVVLCGSVIRTALPTSPPGRPSAKDGSANGVDEEGDEGGAAGSASGGGGASGVPPPPGADVILLSELPPEAQAQVSSTLLLQQQQQKGNGHVTNGSADGNGAKDGNGSGARADINGSRNSSADAAAASASTAAAAGEAGRGVYGEAAAGGLDEHGDVVAPVALAPRPTASLLQRPSRGILTEPESGDEGSADGALAAGSTAAGAPGAAPSSAGGVVPDLEWYLQGGMLGAQSYISVRLVATGQFPLRDLRGEPLAGGLAVPETGPIVISNDPRVFPGTEAVLSDFSTVAGDKLAIRLEYIVDRSSYNEVTLQLFNISRVTRKRTENCLMHVNGKAVNVGDQGVALVPGDEVWFGNKVFCFRVEALPGPPSAVQEALHWFCPAAAPPPDAPDAGGADEDDAAAAAAAPPPLPYGVDGGADMAELSNLSRRDPRHAEALLRRMAAENPGDAAVWLVWAQSAARDDSPSGQAKARLLFRAAVAAARVMEVLPPPPMALQMATRKAFASGRTGRRNRHSGTTSASDADDDGLYSYGTTAPAGAGAAGQAGATASGATEPPRHNWLLVQSLGNWGKHEWRLRMYGSARHLFRAAIDEAAKHPDGIAGGGGAAIMHYWASRELDALNVRNARIVAAEALRKCPADVALYVLAASVELEGGNLDLAKGYCQRAYSLDRTDKQLFLVWPRVEAALGDRVKARLLYERALDMHPLNTKIMNLYARFERDEGSYREAAELYDRALSIDPLSPVMGMHNRADWASLEADLGNTALARSLLEGGLEAHPRSTPLLVTLAKVERLEGRYADALRLVRSAQALAGPFNPAVMTERAQVLRAMGERELAANLSRHVAAVKDLNRMKQQGYWGSEAWRAFIEATRSGEQQAVVAAARQRKLELGWATAVRGTKPKPTGAAGDGRKPTAPEAQQWLQLQQLRLQRAEARRLAVERAARLRAEEGGAGVAVLTSMSSGDEDFNDYYDEPPVGLPSLDSVRRPTPGDEEDVYEGEGEAV